MPLVNYKKRYLALVLFYVQIKGISKIIYTKYRSAKYYCKVWKNYRMDNTADPNKHNFTAKQG